MKMSKVGNQTNSQDPQAVNSRVFVGNLNTFQCSKTDVERMFQRYGRLAGISMHKGYAFVQFTNPFDARSACLGEDGRTVLSQILDVNLVAEPKEHQTGRKRQNITKTGNDWDYYYDSYYASATFPPVGTPRLVPPLKRPRLMVAPVTAKTTAISPKPPPSPTAQINQLKIYSNPDILICGNCREMFTEISELLEHKKSYCKLRFTCKCHTFNRILPSSNHQDQGNASLLCVICKDSFSDAWDLMVHAQAAHMMNIYELGVPKTNSANGDDDAFKNNSPRASQTSTSPRSGSPDTEEQNGDHTSEHEFVNGSQEIANSPDSQTDRSDTELDKEGTNGSSDVMELEPITQSCVMRAHILSGTTEPIVVETNILTSSPTDVWKSPRLSPKVRHSPY